MNFHAYLNDFLFCHVDDSSEANKRLTEIMSLVSICDACGVGITIDKSPFHIKWQRGNLSSLIKDNHELKSCFVAILKNNKLSAFRLNGDDVYGYEEKVNDEPRFHDVTESVMPEAYEADTDLNKSILLNFAESLPCPSVLIQKNSTAAKHIHSFVHKETIVDFFQGLDILKRYYDTNCTYVPNDSETILSDTDLFTPTDMFNKGARLYERNDNKDELWCRDTKHSGSSVHLEVFSRRQNKQIHVSKHDEINFFRELTQRESQRHLYI